MNLGDFGQLGGFWGYFANVSCWYKIIYITNIKELLQFCRLEVEVPF